MTEIAANLLQRFGIRIYALALGIALATAFVPAAGAQDLQDVNRLIKQGQHAQALDKLNSYLAGKPKDPLARFLKGVVLTEQGKTNEAIAIFQALTEEYPELPEPYNNLAVLYASKGQYEKAKLALEMAIQTHPSYATAHENLGDIYAKMASAAYDKALQLDKSNKSAETKLALIRELLPGNGKPGANAKIAAVTPAKTAAAPAAPPATKETKVAAATPAVNTTAPANAAPAAATSAPAVVTTTAAVAATPPAASTAATTPAAPVTAPATPAANDSEAILAALRGWAKDWSNRDVDAYLARYTPDYHPAGETHETWKNARRDRILAPKHISVEILNPKVTLTDASNARVTYRQNYRSDRLSTQSNKTLVLAKQGNAWLIAQEQSGK